MLTVERILAAAEDAVRRFGPEKATVVDVARELGVSHAAVYRHFPSKAALREAVVGRWIERTMPPLRAIAASDAPPEQRLRLWFDTMVAAKRQRAAADPELFAAFGTLAADARAVVAAHVEELFALAGAIIADGVRDGTFATVDPAAAGRAVLRATVWFHHPALAGDWADPVLRGDLDAVWSLVMAGLRRR